MGNLPRLLKPRELAEILRIHPNSVYLLDIPRTKVGGSVRFDEEDVITYLREHRQYHDK